MKRYSQQFLSDLARLLGHGPDQLDRLIEDLADPDKRRKLTEALSHLKNISSSGVSFSSSDSPSSRFSYEDIRVPEIDKADPQKKEMLKSILQTVKMAPALERRSKLADLAFALDVPIAKKDSRPLIIQKVIDSLATRNPSEISLALKRVEEADRGSTESFMDLASFITRDSKPTH